MPNDWKIEQFDFRRHTTGQLLSNLGYELDKEHYPGSLIWESLRATIQHICNPLTCVYEVRVLNSYIRRIEKKDLSHVQHAAEGAEAIAYFRQYFPTIPSRIEEPFHILNTHMNKTQLADEISALLDRAIELHELVDGKLEAKDSGMLMDLHKCLRPAVDYLRQSRRISQSGLQEYNDDLTKKPRNIDTIELDDSIDIDEDEED